MKTEIICENFEQKKIENNRIYVNDSSEEYYIIPLNKGFDMESDDKVFKLTFTNQLLWLKYSNRHKYILLKDTRFTECVLIKSEDIYDIYVKINNVHDCFRKNVWQCDNNISINKKYLNNHFLVLPIIEDMININEFGEGIPLYQIELITNEMLLKYVKDRGRNNGYIVLTNNMLLNKEALFVKLSSDDVGLFVEE